MNIFYKIFNLASEAQVILLFPKIIVASPICFDFEGKNCMWAYVCIVHIFEKKLFLNPWNSFNSLWEICWSIFAQVVLQKFIVKNILFSLNVQLLTSFKSGPDN